MNVDVSIRHGPKPDSHEAEAFTKLEAEALTLINLEAEAKALVMKLKPARGVTQVKTYVNMRVRKVFKWTHISEVHDRKIAPFSEPLPTGHPSYENSHQKGTLIPQFNQKRYPYLRSAQI